MSLYEQSGILIVFMYLEEQYRYSSLAVPVHIEMWRIILLMNHHYLCEKRVKRWKGLKMKALPRCATWSRREIEYDVEQELKELQPGKSLRYQFYDHKHSEDRTKSANAARAEVLDVAKTLGLTVDLFPREDLSGGVELRFWVSLEQGTPPWRELKARQVGQRGVTADKVFEPLKEYLEVERMSDTPISLEEICNHLKLPAELSTYRRLGPIMKELGYVSYRWGQLRASRWKKEEGARGPGKPSKAVTDPLRPIIFEEACAFSGVKFYTSQLIASSPTLTRVLNEQVGRRSLEIRIARILKHLGYTREGNKWIEPTSEIT